MEKEKEALLEALRMALLQIRLLGYKGKKEGLNLVDTQIIADLADIVHNIPETIKRQDSDISFQVDILQSFDEKHPDFESFSPYQAYISYLDK